MNKTILLIGIIGAAALVGLVVARGDTEKNQEVESMGSLSVKESHYDFGTIPMEDGLVTNRYELENASTADVVITKVYTSCMCTKAIIEQQNGKRSFPFGMPGHAGSGETEIAIAGGEKVIVEGIFDPGAHGPSGVGIMERSIFIETNSLETPQVELTFKAVVTRN